MRKTIELQAAGRQLTACFFLVILLVGCGVREPVVTATRQAVGPVPAASATAQPEGEPTPTPVDRSDQLECPSINCYVPVFQYEVKRRCASDTSRSLEDFSRLKITMSITEMCAAVGLPDWETGSGLRIFVYDLADGSRILAGFAGEDQMMYVQQLFANGRSARILMR